MSRLLATCHGHACQFCPSTLCDTLRPRQSRRSIHRRARLGDFIAEQPNLLQKSSREAATVALQYATDVECSSGLVEDASFHSQVKLADQAIHAIPRVSCEAYSSIGDSRDEAVLHCLNTSQDAALTFAADSPGGSCWNSISYSPVWMCQCAYCSRAERHADTAVITKRFFASESVSIPLPLGPPNHFAEQYYQEVWSLTRTARVLQPCSRLFAMLRQSSNGFTGTALGLPVKIHNKLK
jgi:hypothetical protein